MKLRKYQPAVPTQRKTIVVESRNDDNVSPIMDRITSVCTSLQYQVIRWRGPIAGSSEYSRRLPKCDLAFFFNGTHPKYDRYHRRLARFGAATLFVELGWFPQKGTFQIDPFGINCDASWVATPLHSYPDNSSLPVPPKGDLLLLLQHGRDTQITRHSPWFRNMFEFVTHLGRFSRLPVRVRPHPRYATQRKVMKALKRFDMRIDESATLGDALDECRAIACINSSGAVEALARQLPVLCYGHAIYRKEGAVYCLKNDARLTGHVTQLLSDGHCDLDQRRVDEVVRRIVNKQWRIEDIPIRLPGLLEVVLFQHSDDGSLTVGAA